MMLCHKAPQYNGIPLGTICCLDHLDKRYWGSFSLNLYIIDVNALVVLDVSAN